MNGTFVIILVLLVVYFAVYYLNRRILRSPRPRPKPKPRRKGPYRHGPKPM